MSEQTREYAGFIDPPGSGYSGRTKRLLFSGRPLIIITPRYVEHWFARLEPWKHFIPAADAAEAIARAEWAVAHPHESACIGATAREFAHAELKRDDEIDRIATTLERNFERLERVGRT